MTTAEAEELRVWPQTPEDFSRLIELSQDQLVSYAFYRLGNRADAEDVVQDVYIHAFRDREKRRDITEIRAYLYRMTANQCNDVLRKRSRQHDEPTPQGVDVPAADDRLHAIVHLLDQLPDREAEVIRLRTWSELSFAEIAKVEKTSVPTVKSRFRYGVEKLRRLLASQGGLTQ